jgi:hydroxylaminobenzene mutase
MLNIEAQGRRGPDFAEGFVAFSLISLSLAMILVSIVILIGLKRGANFKIE